MKNLSGLLVLSLSFVFFFGCSSDDDVTHAAVGEWNLITWSVGVPLSLNKEKIFIDNILDKTSCDVNEVLSFDTHGTVTLKDAFHPTITISLVQGATDYYAAEEICTEGIIGFSSEYSHSDNDMISFNGVNGTVVNEKLTFVYKDAIKIYNETLTQVIETKDLTLIYQKR